MKKEGLINNYDVNERYKKSTDKLFLTKRVELGAWASYSYMNDPKHLTFALSRYKFVSRMLRNVKGRVLEVGCGDGLGVPITAQNLKHLIIADWDSRNVETVKERLGFAKNISYAVIDFNNKQWSEKQKVQAVYMIDVIEHVDPQNEDKFMRNVLSSIGTKKNAVCIIGTPNIVAASYASPQSAIAHINLKSFETLNDTMEKYFENVFLFGMNDEVVHTGYDSMCHYIWAVGVGLKSQM